MVLEWLDNVKKQTNMTNIRKPGVLLSIRDIILMTIIFVFNAVQERAHFTKIYACVIVIFDCQLTEMPSTSPDGR